MSTLFDKGSRIGRPSYRAYPLDLHGRIEGPAIPLTAQTDDEASREALAYLGDSHFEVWCGTRLLTPDRVACEKFQIVKTLDLLIEVEHVETAHRMTFCVLEDGTDLVRGSFRENPETQRPLTKVSWKGAYILARRAANALGWLRGGSKAPGEATSPSHPAQPVDWLGARPFEPEGSFEQANDASRR